MEVPNIPFKIEISMVNPNSDNIILNLYYPDDETRTRGDKFINEAVNKIANVAINIIYDDSPIQPSGCIRTYKILGSPDQLRSVIDNFGITRDEQKTFENKKKASEAIDRWGKDPKDIPKDEKWW